MRKWISLIALGTIGLASPVQAQFQQDDLIYGLSNSDPLFGIEQLRGPREEFAGEVIANPIEQPFIQAVEFDNLNGISHNPAGNIIGVNFGAGSDTGGSIYNLPTTGQGTGELIGDTLGLGGSGVSVTRLGGVSVSPDNSKIAVTGYDSGKILVYDYAAGASDGTGASLSGARETSSSLLTQFDTQGTTWLDSTSVLAFASSGDIVSVNSVSMETSVVTTLPTEGGADFNYSEYTDIEYNPLVSPYIFASYARFDRDGGPRQAKLYVVDPETFDLVKTIDNSESMDTPREIALDSQGNLFASQFRGAVVIVGNVLDLDSMTDNSTLDWYFPFSPPSFSGLDAAVGLELPNPGVPGDYDGDLTLTATDIDILSESIVAGATDAIYDLNGDGSVTAADRETWVNELRNTYFGDSNLDGEFGTGDLVTVFSAGEYEDTTPGNSGWATGDWNGDGDFNTSDLVTAFSAGGFELGPRAAVSAVPEPSSVVMILVGLLGFGLGRRRR